MVYSEMLSKKLEGADAKEGDRISLRKGDEEYVGRLMAHHDFSAPDILILKMSSGYNIGIRVLKDSEIKVLERPAVKTVEREEPEPRKGLPNISLVSTGGTIASFVDYRTGAVRPAMSASELVDAVPELRDIANIKTRPLFSIFSENMDIIHWQKLADAVAEEINAGADAVIVPHGTDTMSYTAAALSFMLGDVPKPVVLVGAQRSSDRPSSDAFSNLMACARFCAEGKAAGVFVVMHEGLGDDLFSVHIGSRVRKMHTSRRDAFRSINVPPAATVSKDGKVEYLTELRAPSPGKAEARTAMDDGTILLQYYPGMDPKVFAPIISGSRGVVIAGTGLGHVGEPMCRVLKDACDRGIAVIMTTQCLGGTTNMNVYDTGRDLLSAGVIPVGDMLPEVAYVKLMWALANSESVEDAKRMMTETMANESGNRRCLL
ncbi:MAG: Glu-tRNA(Gln) amidotransferase subunit GatD [Thermoplasmatales archaeon]|jgi:glutamyl-tRNA(Gln) amidotransferase subunit D|nr:Glu-tRNA(Gln) amidotransferase subunit GatD [Thermoplasmatales archaeon]